MTAKMNLYKKYILMISRFTACPFSSIPLLKMKALATAMGFSLEANK
jgi:hypothetical protein